VQGTKGPARVYAVTADGGFLSCQYLQHAASSLMHRLGISHRAFGTVFATSGPMAIRKLEEMNAYLLAVDFKLRVYKLIREHPRVERDFRYCAQLRDSASDVEAAIAEGWRRFVAREMAQFLRYALASLEEAKTRLKDGIHRGYFTDDECRETLTIGNRCGAATMALWKSLQPFGRKRPKDAETFGPNDKDRPRD
jgi:four helix bundle protein